MPIDTEQWRAQTGLFCASRVLLRPPRCKQPQPKVQADTLSLNMRFSLAVLLVTMRTGIFYASRMLQLLWLITCHACWLLCSVVRLSCRRLRGVSVLLALCLVVVQMLLIMSGDVEENPGPPKIRTTSLGRTDLSCVREEVLDVSHKWFDIGLKLRLSIGILEGVRDQYSDPSTALREMLLHWLKMMDPPPTWEGLVCALESRTVGEPRLAEQLRTKYCKTEGAAATLPPIATNTSSSDREAAAFPTAATGTHAAYSGAQGARKVSMSSSEAVSLSPESTPGSVCRSDDEVVVPQGQNVTSSNFPYLDYKNLSEQDKLALQCRLLQDSDKITDEFNDLTHYTIESIVSCRVSVKELHTHLSGLGAYKPIHREDPFLRDKLDEIKRAENVKDVFNILHDYYSLFNYHIIKKLIGWFGTPEDKERLKTYTEHFKAFCKRMTFQCPPDIYGRVTMEKTDIVVKVKDSWGPAIGCPVDTVLRLRISLGDILGVEPSTLYLCRIDEGCVELLFQVPSFVGEDIFPLSMEQKRSLTSVGVIRLTCGSYAFPQHHEALVPQVSAQAGTQVKQKRFSFFHESDPLRDDLFFKPTTKKKVHLQTAMTSACVRPPPGTPFSLKNLVIALEKVPEWFELGLQLGIEEHVLQTIEQDHRGQTNRCKSAMLSEWLNNGIDHSWEQVDAAVKEVTRMSEEIKKRDEEKAREQEEERRTLEAVNQIQESMEERIIHECAEKKKKLKEKTRDWEYLKSKWKNEDEQWEEQRESRRQIDEAIRAGNFRVSPFVRRYLREKSLPKDISAEAVESCLREDLLHQKVVRAQKLLAHRQDTKNHQRALSHIKTDSEMWIQQLKDHCERLDRVVLSNFEQIGMIKKLRDHLKELECIQRECESALEDCDRAMEKISGPLQELQYELRNFLGYFYLSMQLMKQSLQGLNERKTKLKKSISEEEKAIATLAGGLAGAAAGAVAGGVIGAVGGPPGVLLGLAIGGAIGAVKGSRYFVEEAIKQHKQNLATLNTELTASEKIARDCQRTTQTVEELLQSFFKDDTMYAHSYFNLRPHYK